MKVTKIYIKKSTTRMNQIKFFQAMMVTSKLPENLTIRSESCRSSSDMRAVLATIYGSWAVLEGTIDQ